MVKTTKIRTAYFFAAMLVLAAAIGVENTIARDGSSTRRRSQNTGRMRQGQTDESRQKDARRLREGTVVSDASGFFREDGDGATFVADMGLEFGSLPNLNLERVLRHLKSSEEPNSIRWSVTGRVTEFSGRNFLLISRAVYKSATPPPVPDHVTH